jgi:hypothetical protein
MAVSLLAFHLMRKQSLCEARPLLFWYLNLKVGDSLCENSSSDGGVAGDSGLRECCSVDV